MAINSFLSQSDVVIGLQVKDKVGLLKELSARAARKLHLPAQAVADEIQKRDELGSTGIGGGVAIPHARFRQLQKSFGYLARLERPIAYEAIDGQPVDVVFLLLLPAASQLEQLNTLAAAARKLRDPEVVRRIRASTSSAEAYGALAD
jgi:nitrogen PTS system EIIA component